MISYLLNLLKKRLSSLSCSRKHNLPAGRHAYLCRKGFTHTLSLALRSFLGKFTTQLFKARKKTPNLVCGFTLIELVITVGIMIVVTTVVLFNYTTFNKRIKLEGVTQEIASIVRETQAYGIGNKVIAGTSNSYGVHFDTVNPYQVIVFFDDDGDGVYNSGIDTIEETFTMQSSSRIAQICINQKAITPDPCTYAILSIDVIYKRSDIYATIGGNPTTSDAVIFFRSVGETAGGVKVVIWKSGQVSVEAE